jgi:hypothetical protein
MTIKIKLLKPHTHAEINHDIDAEIDVDDIDAQWLIENEIGVKVAEAKGKKSEQA